jgi:hypothetical protein
MADKVSGIIGGISSALSDPFELGFVFGVDEFDPSGVDRGFPDPGRFDETPATRAKRRSILERRGRLLDASQIPTVESELSMSTGSQYGTGTRTSGLDGFDWRTGTVIHPTTGEIVDALELESELVKHRASGPSAGPSSTPSSRSFEVSRLGRGYKRGHVERVASEFGVDDFDYDADVKRARDAMFPRPPAVSELSDDPIDLARRKLGQRISAVPSPPSERGVRYTDVHGSVRHMPTDLSDLLAEESRALSDIEAIHRHRGQIAMEHGFGSEVGPRSALQRGRELDQFWRDVDGLERLPPKGAQKASWDALTRDPRYNSMPGMEWDLDTHLDAAKERLRAARRGIEGPSGPRTEVDRLFNKVKQMARDQDVSSRRGAFELLKGEEGFMRGVAPSARSTAARGLATTAGVVAAPFIDYALDPDSRTPVQFARKQEESITQRPILGLVGLGEHGLASPSELPPPAVLPPDRLKAVEATHGMVGVAPDPETPNVTAQEVRTFIRNRVAKGKKLPKWAEGITSMEGGRLSIKPVNPRDEARKERKKARQEAAKPQNPRMGGPKRKHGGGY